MPVYATVDDVQRRSARTLNAAEVEICETLLADASVMIDSFAPAAAEEKKLVVACRMVLRAMPSGDAGIPVGATQGSISALSYSQSWTVSGGGVGELYLSKMDKQLLGLGDRIGSRSPLEDRVCNGGGLECAALM